MSKRTVFRRKYTSVIVCEGKMPGDTRASTLNTHSLPDIMCLDALRVGYEIYLDASILWSFPNMVLSGTIKSTKHANFWLGLQVPLTK